jgi:preprotein translocase subunit SecG
MIFVHSLVIVLFVVLGLVFSAGKGAFLIAGYNTASPSEKAKVHEGKLCKYMGRLMFLLAACWLVLALSALLDRMWLLWLGLGLFLAVCLGGVVFIQGHTKA